MAGRWRIHHDEIIPFRSFSWVQETRRLLSKNLKAIIKRRGYRTVELFAHENGFDKGWIHRILRGETDPSFGRVVKLAKALGTDLNSLYPGKKRRA
jgi:transcriptional regulator with XRE-family HTH domain